MYSYSPSSGPLIQGPSTMETGDFGNSGIVNQQGADLKTGISPWMIFIPAAILLFVWLRK